MEVAPALLVAPQDVRRLLEQPHGLDQQVVEVERADRPEPLVVEPREPGDHPVVPVDGGLGEGVGSTISFFARLIAPRITDGRNSPVAGMSSAFRICFIERGLVVRVVDHEPAVDPDRLAVAPQHPRADRVERAGLDVPAGLADEADDPFPQLGGGAVGEGHREDLPRPDALDADQVGDAMREDAGLAAAGARQDEQRPVGRRDGPACSGLRRATMRASSDPDTGSISFGRAPSAAADVPAIAAPCPAQRGAAGPSSPRPVGLRPEAAEIERDSSGPKSGNGGSAR